MNWQNYKRQYISQTDRFLDRMQQNQIEVQDLTPNELHSLRSAIRFDDLSMSSVSNDKSASFSWWTALTTVSGILTAGVIGSSLFGGATLGLGALYTAYRAVKNYLILRDVNSMENRNQQLLEDIKKIESGFQDITYQIST